MISYPDIIIFVEWIFRSLRIKLNMIIFYISLEFPLTTTKDATVQNTRYTWHLRVYNFKNCDRQPTSIILEK